MNTKPHGEYFALDPKPGEEYVDRNGNWLKIVAIVPGESATITYAIKTHPDDEGNNVRLVEKRFSWSAWLSKRANLKPKSLFHHRHEEA